MQELLVVKKDPVQATVIHQSSATQKQKSSQRSRIVPNSVGYLDSNEVSWSENPDSAASMFSPSLNIWEETFMDLESVCATKSPSDMADATKRTSSVVADDELNTPIIGNEFSFNPSGVVSRDVISSAPCLNFGNVSDCWENLYISPCSVTNIEEAAALKEPSFISDMCFNPVQDNSVIPHKVEGTLKLPALTQTTPVPPTSVQNYNTGITINRTEQKPVAVKAPASVTMAPLAVAASSQDNIQIVYNTEEVQSVAATSTTNFPVFTENVNMTAEKDSKRKELKLNLAPVFSLDDISTPVVFEALDADGNVNLMEFIANDDFNPASDSDLDVIQYIIGQTEEEEGAEKEVEVNSVLSPSALLQADEVSNTTAAQIPEAAFPVKMELISNVHEDEAENVEVWEVTEENATPQMGLKLKILKQKNNKTGSEGKRSATKRIQGKRVSSSRSSAANKSDDYCDDNDDDEEYFPTKRSRTTRRRRLTSASSSSSMSRSPGTSRQRSSVSHVADIEERYRELRDKNNEASRKSRLNRKAKEADLQVKVVKLERENQTLRIRADELEKLVTKLRESLVEIVKNPKH